MGKPYQDDIGGGEKSLFHKDGKTYFSKKSERNFYFVLTLIMMMFGILTKAGLF